MKKRKRPVRRANIQRRLPPLPASATVTGFDGKIGAQAVRLEFVFQPKDAQRLADSLVNTVLRRRNPRK